ncbi:MAG: exopolyphosphatase [Kibdelosporangium sp.]
MTQEPPRLGVLDVGCFSAHLFVTDGSLLTPALSHKIRLRLDRAIGPDGRISRDGINRITDAVAQARTRADRIGMPPMVAFATSSIRDATNAAQVVAHVARHTGVQLRVMSGEREAHLSYVAARNWFGHSAGMLVVLDVGGGTAELSVGDDNEPLHALSIPLGARTLARAGLDNAKSLPSMRAEVLERVEAALADFPDVGNARAVGCSKVFQQMARLAGARPQRDGAFVPRRLRLDDLTKWIPRLGRLPAHQRAELPGISRHRAHQSLAGAVLAEALMKAIGHDVVDISPWSTKEGLLLSLQQTTGFADGDDDGFLNGVPRRRGGRRLGKGIRSA